MNKFMVTTRQDWENIFYADTGQEERIANESHDIVEASYMDVKEGAVCFYTTTHTIVAIYPIKNVMKIRKITKQESE